MLIKNIVVGTYEVNCFLLKCEEDNATLVIDPGDDLNDIMKAIKDNNMEIKYIINTHAHADHIGAVSGLRMAFDSAKYLMHEQEVDILTASYTKEMADFMGLILPAFPDRLLQDGDIITLCPHLQFKVLHIPGHTPGGIALHTNMSVWTGDSLFAGSIGRTDFPMGSHDDLIKYIKTKLLVLDKDTKIYPGHGPESTIGEEIQYNPYLR